jgi:Repeat of unknown function (DUF5648)
MKTSPSAFIKTTLAMGLSVSLLQLSAQAHAADTVYEFYNTTLKHYFITVDAAEAAVIEGGGAGPGWSRTGKTFNVFKTQAAAPAGSVAVCRFYGNVAAGGPNSHFYTSELAECNAVKQDPGWKFERIEFYVQSKPAAANCPASSAGIYRAYNKRFAEKDSNHRYTADLATYNEMIAAGWAGEGVVFCAESANTTPTPPTPPASGAASDNCGALFVKGKSISVRYTNDAASGTVVYSATRSYLEAPGSFLGATTIQSQDIFDQDKSVATTHYRDDGATYAWLGIATAKGNNTYSPPIAYPKSWAVGQVLNFSYSIDDAGVGPGTVTGTMTLTARESVSVTGGSFTDACKFKLTQTTKYSLVGSTSVTNADVWTHVGTGVLKGSIKDSTSVMGFSLDTTSTYEMTKVLK